MMQARNTYSASYSACLSAAAMYLSGPTVQAVDSQGGLTPTNTPDESSTLTGLQDSSQTQLGPETTVAGLQCKQET